MYGRSTIIIAVLAIAALMPAQTLAVPSNSTSTHTYIQANFALARQAVARIGATQAGVVRFRQRLSHECGQVGAGSPQSEDAQKLGLEAAGALWSLSFGSDAKAIHAFVGAVEPLRWSSSKLTAIAHGYAKSLGELATLPTPHLCGDVRAWSASGFQTIPASTIDFDRRVEATEGHSSIPPRLLTPYVQPADRGILERTTQLEAKLEHTEFETGFDDWASLLDTLALHQ
jgi:hypothetical protein